MLFPDDVADVSIQRGLSIFKIDETDKQNPSQCGMFLAQVQSVKCFKVIIPSLLHFVIRAEAYRNSLTSSMWKHAYPS